MADRFSSKNIALITIAILLVIMLISSFRIWPMIKQEKLLIIKEGVLEKISSHQLSTGESYAYNYSSENESVTVHYGLVQRSGCLEFTVSEIKNNGTSCIKADGTDSGGSNLTLNNQFIYFFRPWMLAVKPGWNWNVDIYTNITTVSKLSSFKFYFAGETSYRGREAFIVKQTEDNSNNEATMLIDKEKRILLKEEGNGYQVEIIYGPFLLAQQGE